VLGEKVGRSSSVTLVDGVEVKKVRGLREKLRLEYSPLGSSERSIIESDYVLIAVGRDPFLDFVEGDLLEEIEVLVRRGRVYLIGDVRNGQYRQVGISVGDGLKAAMRISQGIAGEAN
jgi:thioredoxin reductase